MKVGYRLFTKAALALLLGLTLSWGAIPTLLAGYITKDKNELAKRHQIRGACLFIRSENIEAAIAPNGQFTIGVPNGPILLFGHPNPWSSATTVRVDGVDYWNYDEAQLAEIIDGPKNISDLVNETTWNINGVYVTQRLSIVGDNKDIVKFTYIIKNTSSSVHEVGLRLMLDTMLGDNDGAPFRVPGTGAVMSEREWVGSDVPAYWQAFDRLEEWTVATEGTLVGGDATIPDRLVAAHWAHISGSAWDFTPDPSIIFSTPGQTGTQPQNDSAVGLYWEPVLLRPLQSRVIITYFGRTRFQVFGDTLLCSEFKVEPSPLSSASDYYIVKVDVQAEQIDQTNVRIKLETESDKLKIIGDAEQLVPLIKEGTNETKSWKVQPTGKERGTSVSPVETTIKVTAVSDQVSQAVSVSGKAQLGPIFLPEREGWKFINTYTTFASFIPIKWTWAFWEIGKYFPTWDVWKRVYGESEASKYFWERNVTKADETGWCYGMSGFALQRSYSPTYDYKNSPNYSQELDEQLAFAIFATQIKQFSRNQIKARLENKGVNKVLGYFNSNNWDAVLCITTLKDPQTGKYRAGAHALVPFAIHDENGYKSIFVYDPNRPGEWRKIIIGQNKWSYQFSNDWEWGTDTGGEIWYIPISEFPSEKIIPHWAPPDGDFTDNLVALTLNNGEKIYKVAFKDEAGFTWFYNPLTGEIEGPHGIDTIFIPICEGTNRQEENQAVHGLLVFPISKYSMEIQAQKTQRQSSEPVGLNFVKPGGMVGVSFSQGLPDSMNVDFTKPENPLSLQSTSSALSTDIDLFKESEHTEGYSHIAMDLDKGSKVNAQQCSDGNGVVLSLENGSATANVEVGYITDTTVAKGTALNLELTPSQPVRIRLKNPTDPESSVLIEVDKNNDGTFEEQSEIGMDKVEVSLPTGIYPLSLPIIPSDTSWSFLVNGDEKLKLAFWDKEKQTYQILELPTPEILPDLFKASVGYGTWVSLPSPRKVQLRGTLPGRLALSSIPLKAGWNLIGVLGTQDIQWSVDNIRVRSNGEILTLTDAQKKGWVEDFAWGWEQDPSNPSTGKYVLVYDNTKLPSVSNIKGTLEPWKGYWFYAFRDCELIYPSTVSQTKVKRENIPSKISGWTARLRVRAGQNAGEVLFGVVQAQRPLIISLPPNPPIPCVNKLQVMLMKNEFPLAVDIRNEQLQKQEWEILVRWDNSQQGKQEIVMTFEGIGYAPKGFGIWLVDLSGGKRVYLRTTASYRFIPSEGESQRRFKIILEKENTLAPWVTGLRVVPQRGGGAAICFSLAKPARVRVEIQAVTTGQKVAEIGSGEVYKDAGEQRFIWQGTDSQGRQLPSGVYLVRVIAVDEDRRWAQAIAMFTLR